MNDSATNVTGASLDTCLLPLKHIIALIPINLCRLLLARLETLWSLERFTQTQVFGLFQTTGSLVCRLPISWSQPSVSRFSLPFGPCKSMAHVTSQSPRHFVSSVICLVRRPFSTCVSSVLIAVWWLPGLSTVKRSEPCEDSRLRFLLPGLSP